MAIPERWPSSGSISVSWNEERETWDIYVLVRDTIKKEKRSLDLCFRQHEMYQVVGGLPQWYNWMAGKIKSEFSMEDWNLLEPHFEPAFQKLKEYMSGPPQEPVSIMVPEEYPSQEGNEDLDRWDMI
jgi:hypothetical protein